MRGTLKHLQEGLAAISGIFEYAYPVHSDFLLVFIKRQEEELLFAAEAGVKAGGANTHSLSEVVHRDAFVAAFPEEKHGRGESDILVECSRTSAAAFACSPQGARRRFGGCFDAVWVILHWSGPQFIRAVVP